jgi:hypothetical protein
MSKKTRSSRKQKSDAKTELESEIDRMREEIAKTRVSNLSRLEKTKKINLLRKKLAGITRTLQDL